MTHELQWDGDAFYLTYTVDDPNGVLPGHQNVPHKDPDGSWRMLLDKGKLYRYDPAVGVAQVRDPKGDFSDFFGFFAISPPADWFNCCPPNTYNGRPWIELIGPHPAIPDQAGTRFEYLRDGDLVTQIRHDEGRGKMTTVFDLSKAGNVITSTYEPLDQTKSTSRLKQVWLKDKSGGFVLRSREYIHSAPGKPDVAQSLYSLTVDQVEIGAAVDELRLSSERFLAELPIGTTLHDTFTGEIKKTKK